MNDWRTRAACRGATQLFYPEEGEGRPAAAEPAKAICATCPVREPCLEYAVTAGEKHGVWGGLTVTQLRKLRAMRRPPVAERPCVVCGTLYLPRPQGAVSGRPQKTCSARCRRIHERLYAREYQRGMGTRGNGEMFDIGHGTITRYQDGCRCQACGAVSRDRRRVARIGNRTHGLLATYNAGCRCEECHQARADKHRADFDMRVHPIGEIKPLKPLAAGGERPDSSGYASQDCGTLVPDDQEVA